MNNKTFDFSQALLYLKAGKKLTRTEWNNKGMYVYYQKGYPNGVPCNKQTAEACGINEGDLFKCNPYLQIKCADCSFSIWIPSINDLLSEDWLIYELDTIDKNNLNDN